MEARKILMEQGRGTAADASFVSQVCGKWAPLLEGINDSYQRGVMGILLENQMDHLKQLNEETLSTGVGSFTKYIFPILRRVFPNLIANQIVSVQPMSAPVGGIFTYEYKYENSKGRATADNNLVQDFQKYYSSEYIDYEIKVSTANVDGIKKKWDAATNKAERFPFKWLPLMPKDESKGDEYRVSIHYADAAGAALRMDDDGAGVLKGVTVGGDAGTVDYKTGDWSISLTAAPKAGTAIYATYCYNSELVGTTDVPSLDAANYAGTDQVAAIPAVNIDIALTTVTAITRKLKARWSAEAVDDLRAFHGLNAETELVAGISNEIALELDREIIDDLVGGAKFSTTWDYGPAFGGANTMTELESVRSILTAIESVSAQIHKASLRAPANFIVCSPAIGAVISQLTTHGDFMMVNRAEEPVVSPSYGPMNSNFGVQRIGTLMNKYAVYQDPFLANDKMLIGLKGSSFLDAGYVYAPYIPLQVTPTFLDPDDFTFRKGLRTRYAKKMLRPEYYGVLSATNLPLPAGI